MGGGEAGEVKKRKREMKEKERGRGKMKKVRRMRSLTEALVFAGHYVHISISSVSPHHPQKKVTSKFTQPEYDSRQRDSA